MSGYPVSWYPLCRSSDLKPGQARRVVAWGRPWAVWRSAAGQVSALEAICSHMGADLGRGRVVGEALQCPLHHWQYGADGRCVHIPASAAIPARACQQALPCIERYGLVFGALGDPPAFPPFAGEGQARWSRPSVTDAPIALETLVANSFDGQHFATVHDRELLAPVEVAQDGPHHLRIAYRARVAGRRLGDRLMRAVGIATVGIEIHCWGGNLMQVYNKRTPNTILVAILPVEAGRSLVFVTTVMAQRVGGLQGVIQRLQLAVAHRFTLAFLRPDLAALAGMALRPRVLLPEADSTFVAWLRYWRALPRPDGQATHNGHEPALLAFEAAQERPDA
ncbi:MAG TPA: Rieske (2Fe-2S) protein [Caldilineaceae bacterium]|nr:Rieske (2Fe-2S) protein [Caldilineaceae bacterium]